MPGAVVVVEGTGVTAGWAAGSVAGAVLVLRSEISGMAGAVSGPETFSAVAVSTVFLSSVQPKKQKSEADSKRELTIFMR